MFAFFFFKKIATEKDTESQLRQVNRLGQCMHCGIRSTRPSWFCKVREPAFLPERLTRLCWKSRRCSWKTAWELAAAGLAEKSGASLRRLAILGFHLQEVCLTWVFMKYNCLLKPKELKRAGEFKSLFWEPMTRRLQKALLRSFLSSKLWPSYPVLDLTLSTSLTSEFTVLLSEGFGGFFYVCLFYGCFALTWQECLFQSDDHQS